MTKKPAAKKGDKISSDGTSQVWVQCYVPLQPPYKYQAVAFSYEGNIDSVFSSSVFIMSKPAAMVGSTATNSTPPNKQSAVTTQGNMITVANNTATITKGSSTVFINGYNAARSEDIAKTWDYSTPPPPGNNNAKEIENAKVKAEGSVYVGD